MSCHATVHRSLSLYQRDGEISKLALRAVGSFYQARGLLFKIADGFPRLPLRSYLESYTIHVVMSWGSMSGIRTVASGAEERGAEEQPGWNSWEI